MVCDTVWRIVRHRMADRHPSHSPWASGKPAVCLHSGSGGAVLWVMHPAPLVLEACRELPHASGPAPADPGRLAGLGDHELCRALDPQRPELARRALAELYGRHAGGVRGFLEQLLHDRALAEDALQETFLAAARHGRGQRARSARAWLIRIAANRARDLLRAQRRREVRQEVASRSELQPAREPELLDEELQEALRRLPATERTALELRFAQELTHAEAAAILGVSVRTAKSWVARGLERLRRALDGDEE